MRHVSCTSSVGLLLTLALLIPAPAIAQAAAPAAGVPPGNLRLPVSPSLWRAGVPIVKSEAPRVKPNGPVFGRVFGGFIAGQSIVGIAGFLVGGGVALPIAHREDMEIQIDFTYAKYSGGPDADGIGTTEIEGTALAPTALFLYNFVREGRGVTPFIGAGVIIARTDETETYRETFGSFNFVSVFTRKQWLTGPQGVAGVQIPMGSSSTLRLEGRIALTSLPGILVAVMAGVSF
jgi:opacity protein-like surface antigen